MADSKLNVTVDARGAVSGAQKAVKALNNIGAAAQRAENSLKKLDGRTVRIKVDGRALSRLRTTAESTRKAVEAISKITVRPKVDARALTNLRKTAQSTATALRQINRISINPKSSVAGLSKLQRSSDKTKSKLKEINRIKVAPNVSGKAFGAFQTALATTSKQMVGLSAQTSAYGAVALKTGTVASASLLKVSQSANVATASIGRLAAAQASVGAATAAGAAAGAASGAIGGGTLKTALAAKGLTSFAGKLTKTSVAARAFGVAMGAAKLAVGLFVAATGLAAAKLLGITLKFSDAAIMIRNRIRLVTDTTNELNQVTNELFRQSRDARVQLTAQAELYQRIGLSMEQLGASTEEVLAATEATAKAITLSAVTYQAANATIIQFGQALAFGKLRGDELRSVLEQSPRLAQALADGLGIARGELIKFGFAGKLASDRVFKALISQLPQLRKEFKEISPRISEARNVLDNALIRLSGAVNNATGVSDAFAQAILSLADFITEKTPVILQALLEIKLAWLSLKGIVMAPIDFAEGMLGKLADLADYIPSDQEIVKAPFDALAAGIDAVNGKIGNWKELRVGGEIVRQFGDDVANGFTKAGEAITGMPDFVASQIPSPTWMGVGDMQDLYDEAVGVARDINAISIERKELQIDINARDAARDAQNAANGLKTVIDGVEIKKNIDLEVNGAKAEVALPRIQKDISDLKERQIRLDVMIDMPAAEQELQDLTQQMALFKDKDSAAFQAIQRRQQVYAAIVEEVKDSNNFIGAGAELEGTRLEKAEAIRKTYAAMKKLFAEIPEDAGADASKREDLIRQRDPTADTRRINAFIKKQKDLIVELTTQEGIERDLALLRLEAGDAAVSAAEEQIRANQALIDSKQKIRDIEDEIKEASESLDEQIEKTKGLTESERLRNELGQLRVRTVEEQAAVEAAQLDKYLTGLYDIDEKLKKNILSEEKLNLIRKLNNTISPAEKERLENEIKRVEAKERQLAIEEKLKAIRDKTLKDAESRVEEGDQSTPAAERLHRVQQIQLQIKNTREEIAKLAKDPRAGVIGTEQQAQLETLHQALELYLKDLQEATGLFQDFSVDAVELMRETADQMTSAMEDFFFDIMQGNFDNLLENLIMSWKAAIDRMVAQAIAADLAKKLFGNSSEGSFGQWLGDVFFGLGGGGSGGGSSGGGSSGGGSGGPKAYKGGFIAPNAFTEVNELGQEALILGAKKFLIPMGEEISRTTPPALMGQVRGLESGGFAHPHETVEINERGLEALRMGDVTKILGGMSMGSSANETLASGFDISQGSTQPVLGGATLVSLPGSFPPPSPGQESLPRSGTAQFYTDDAARRLKQTTETSNVMPQIYNMEGRTFMKMGSTGGFVVPHEKTKELIQRETSGKIPGREFGGAVQSRSVYEVNEGVLPELLSIGSRDFLLTGGSSGYVTPVDSASELGMNQNINVTIVSPDVDGFRKTQGQIQNELGRAASLANRRNG